jgi:cytochrome oxidase Cu insertion factor (SCO1/SenC/PrrC family)
MNCRRRASRDGGKLAGFWAIGLLADPRVLCSAMAVVEYESEDGSVRQAGEVPPRPIVDFALTDSENAEFNSQDLRGQVWVVSFFFSKCPSICRQQNEIARRLWREFRAQDVRFVSITCDPEEDTPERLKEYAKLYEADPEEWMFLTGDMDRISQIGEESFQLGVGYRTHSDRFVAVDKWGRVRGIYDWHDPRQLGRAERETRSPGRRGFAAGRCGSRHAAGRFRTGWCLAARIHADRQLRRRVLVAAVAGRHLGRQLFLHHVPDDLPGSERRGRPLVPRVQRPGRQVRLHFLRSGDGHARAVGRLRQTVPSRPEPVGSF